MVSILARYASRFSVRALDLTVDFSLVWVGIGLALVAAVILAYVPKLPVSVPTGSSSGGVRITSGTNRRLRIFATTQIAACFLLLAGAGMLLKTLLALQTAQTGLDTRHVLAVNLPVMQYGRTTPQIISFYEEVVRRVKALPGVDDVALGSSVPWRDAGGFGPGFQFAAEGVTKAAAKEDPRARFRAITPRFFASLGVPIMRAADFNESDRADSESVRRHQREPRAPDVPEPGRGEPPYLLDRSGDEVHRRPPESAPHRRRCDGRSTTKTSCPGRRSRSIIRSSRFPASSDACSCTPVRIRTGSSRR